MRKRKDVEWEVENVEGKVTSWEQAQAAILMDIRDELKKLNYIFNCGNFLDIPRKLDKIQQNTRKPAKRKLKMVKP